MSQTITVTFSPGQTEAVAETALEQWAYGQRLQFAGLNLPAAYQVDFSNFEFCGDSIPRIGGADGVAVPVDVLASGENVYAFIWLQTADSGRRAYRVMIRVIPGPLPNPEEPNPEEESAIAEAIAALNDAVEAAETAEANAQASEAAAAGSATEAASSAQAAGSSASAAAGSATEAASSAQEAGSSASAAAGSATSAGNSATAAASSASAAASSETAAGQAATDAAASGTAAGASAASAASSASAASGSATSASGSAATATQKASEASASATAAAGSATSAGNSATAAAASATAAGNAQTAAETAQGKAEDAQEAAETAQAAAEAAAASVSESAAQIAQNTEDVADLKSAIKDLDEFFEVENGYENNLLDARQIVYGKVLNADGTVTANDGFNYFTQFFFCPAGYTLIISAKRDSDGTRVNTARRLVKYDTNKNVIGAVDGARIYNDGSDDIFVRFTVFATGYTLYSVGLYYGDQNRTTPYKSPIFKLSDLVTYDSTEVYFESGSKNILNDADVEKDTMLSYRTSLPMAASGYITTPFLAVPAGKTIFISGFSKGYGARRCKDASRIRCVFDKDKTFLVGVDNSTESFAYTNDSGETQFVRWSCNTNASGGFLEYMVQLSDEATVADASGYPVDKVYVPFFYALSNNVRDLRLDEKVGQAELGFATVADYYSDELEETVESVLSHIGEPAFTMVWLSDVHYDPDDQINNLRVHNTYRNIHALNNRVALMGITNTGDFVKANTPTLTQAMADNRISYQRGLMIAANPSIFLIQGNHDGAGGSVPANNNFNCMAVPNNSKIVRDGNNPYFYADYPVLKLRCIYLAVPDKSAGAVVWGISDQQLTWLHNTLLHTEDDYSVVIFGHIGTYMADFVTNKTEICNLVNSFHNHTGDFTAKTGAVVAYFCGHTHIDGIAKTSQSGMNFPVIAITSPTVQASSATNIDYTAVTRTPFTASWDAWDTIIWRPDESKLYLVRFGAGEDRTINLATWDTSL